MPWGAATGRETTSPSWVPAFTLRRPQRAGASPYAASSRAGGGYALPEGASPRAPGETRRESCNPVPEGHHPLHCSPRARPPARSTGAQSPDSRQPHHARSQPRPLPIRPCSRSLVGSSSWVKRYGRGGRDHSPPRVWASHLLWASLRSASVGPFRRTSMPGGAGRDPLGRARTPGRLAPWTPPQAAQL